MENNTTINDKDFTEEADIWFENHLKMMKKPKKSKQKRTQPEFEIQKKVVEYLNDLKNANHICAYYSTINEASHMNSTKAKQQGLVKGTSDMTIILKDGFVLFLELKKDKPILKSGKLSKVNYQSKDQIDFENSINRPINVHSRYKCTYGLKETTDMIHKFVMNHQI